MIGALDIAILILAIPLGLILAKINSDEKKIYNNPPYFPIFLWPLAIISAIFFTLNSQIAMTLTFSWLTILVWSKDTEIKNIFKKWLS